MGVTEERGSLGSCQLGFRSSWGWPSCRRTFIGAWIGELFRLCDLQSHQLTGQFLAVIMGVAALELLQCVVRPPPLLDIHMEPLASQLLLSCPSPLWIFSCSLPPRLGPGALQEA